MIKTIYKNLTNKKIEILLPDYSTVIFPEKDSIRLNITRKYLNEGIMAILHEADFSVVDRKFTDLGEPSKQFGVDLFLLKCTSGSKLIKSTLTSHQKQERTSIIFSETI